MRAAEVAHAQLALLGDEKSLGLLAGHLGEVVDVLIAAVAVADARVARHAGPALGARCGHPDVGEDGEAQAGLGAVDHRAQVVALLLGAHDFRVERVVTVDQRLKIVAVAHGHETPESLGSCDDV